ncbi:MAG: NADH-quinone oxidoreductase subunit M [Actinobacteria bacterium]|nr:NADH-quinone oxidoreductase subunit M [Actinomycetota bacterium]
MSILTTLQLLPLFGAIVIAAMPVGNAKLIKQIALGFSLLVTAVSIVMTFGFETRNNTLQFTESRTWISAFNINYAVGIDGMALALILMTTILVPIVFLAGWNESENGRWNVKTFYILLLILETMMIGVFAATDVFLFYVIFEAMLLPVYFLIGGYGVGDRAAAAMKFLLYSLFGGLLMLAAVIGLYIISTNQGGGTFDITKLSELTIDAPTQNWLFLGFFIAFAIKAPLWPFHTWLPTAAKSSTAGTSTLLLGVLDKVGTYGMIRFCMSFFPEATKTFTPAIITLAVISILYGAFLAIGQKDINSLIAFTSISHFGFITLGIFALTSQGLTGAIFYMVNHGFSTAALFLTAGWMIKRRGSTQISDFGGLQRVTPVLAWSFFLAGMSALALPGLSSFVSEFLVLLGSFAKYPVAAILGTTGIILAALYVLIAVQKSLHGETSAPSAGMVDLNLREKIAIAPVILVLVFLGFYPKPVLNVINPTTQTVMTHAGVSDPIAKVAK